MRAFRILAATAGVAAAVAGAPGGAAGQGAFPQCIENERAARLLATPAFTNVQTGGLAILCTAGFTAVYHVHDPN